MSSRIPVASIFGVSGCCVIIVEQGVLTRNASEANAAHILEMCVPC